MHARPPPPAQTLSVEARGLLAALAEDVAAELGALLRPVARVDHQRGAQQHPRLAALARLQLEAAQLARLYTRCGVKGYLSNSPNASSRTHAARAWGRAGLATNFTGGEANARA